MNPLANVEQARFGIGLDTRQTALVCEGLAELPYRDVHGLIRRLARWDGAGPFVLSHGELLLVLHALGALPYRRVHALIGALERQLAALREREVA